MPLQAEPTDAELVVLARDGDRAAFSELHARTARMVHAVLLARVSATDADDLVQDVFLTALSRLGSLSDPDKFGPWILQIARNRATDVHRRPRLVELPEEMPSRARPSVEAAQVLGHIRALPEAYRETLLMRLVEGMTGPEIAEKTGLTAGSVRVNLHRGMKLLRDRLGAT